MKQPVSNSLEATLAEPQINVLPSGQIFRRVPPAVRVRSLVDSLVDSPVVVKNVLLYREKTLARKLQELFLTWHVENTLTKDRIMEIYLNVIEYGPNIYGIGPAALHYFGKPAKDLNPVEAAFFSTILPSPKERYKQYCQGTLTRWTNGKIERILAIMQKRDRLTQAEYDTALVTPLLFAKDGTETELACMDRVKKAIKNARSTNPLRH